MNTDYKCILCGNTFNENEAKITEIGTQGGTLSKTELLTCPECDSTKIINQEGKIQSY